MSLVNSPVMKELKCFRRDERMPVQNLGSLCSDRARTPSGLITRHSSLPMGFWSQKKVFWKNEPKPGPSLLTIVKKRTQNEPK
jgi:hypothetical protein